jgi:hypothetical protein
MSRDQANASGILLGLRGRCPYLQFSAKPFLDSLNQPQRGGLLTVFVPVVVVMLKMLDSKTTIVTADNSTGTVEALHMVVQPQPMFNLTVDEAHTFSVGDSEWLVDNLCWASKKERLGTENALGYAECRLTAWKPHQFRSFSVDGVDNMEQPDPHCRVCGLEQDEPPRNEQGRASYDICVCCGTEAGFDDLTLTGVRQRRKEWLDNGAQWFRKREKPPDWDLEQQLKNIPPEYR